MAFILQEQKVIANEQRFEFTNITIDRSGEGKLTARVSFNIFNEKNQSLGSDTLSYEGEAFNTFWTDFTSGSFLYNELAKRHKIQTTVEAESDFTNVIAVPEVEEEEQVE